MAKFLGINLQKSIPQTAAAEDLVIVRAPGSTGMALIKMLMRLVHDAGGETPFKGEGTMVDANTGAAIDIAVCTVDMARMLMSNPLVGDKIFIGYLGSEEYLRELVAKHEFREQLEEFAKVSLN